MAKKSKEIDTDMFRDMFLQSKISPLKVPVSILQSHNDSATIWSQILRHELRKLTHLRDSSLSYTKRSLKEDWSISPISR